MIITGLGGALDDDVCRVVDAVLVDNNGVVALNAANGICAAAAPRPLNVVADDADDDV